jgi:enhancing lycopene biosynthesis protein 2
MLRCSLSLLAKKKPVAVLLSGCGVFDGSEIHEATSLLIHLSRLEREYQILAPNRKQFHVVNHQRGEPDVAGTRLMLDEAARIARGAVIDATEAGKTRESATMFAESYSALLLPGGFGVMKNLSTFAVDPTPSVLPEVDLLLAAFHSQKKPIGAACIAPVLLANRFPGCSITLGATTGEPQDLARKLHAKLVDCSKGGVAIDGANRLVSVPAYMVDGAGPYDVFRDIGLLVDTICGMLDQ